MLTMGKSWNLSEYLTGFLVVGLGTSLNEIYWARITFHEITDIYINTMFGSNIFELCVVGGSLMLWGSFHYNTYFLLRDTIFLAINVIWMEFVMFNRQITIYESSFMVLLYIVYIVVLVIESKVMRRKLCNGI